MNEKTIAAIVIMRNEEANIARCLESLSWTDEIVVVDSESSDAGVEIARRFTDRIFVEPWKGFGAQKNFAIDQVTCEWIFSIDADEVVTSALSDEIRDVVQREDNDRAYMVPRCNWFCGRFLRYGGTYPDYQLRLFPRGSGRYSDRPVHERFLTRLPIIALKQNLLHYGYPNLTSFYRRLDVYTTLGAQQQSGAGRSARGVDLVLRPAWKFVRGYFINQGYRDGRQGFVFAALSAIQVFMRSTKVWEIEIESHATERQAAPKEDLS